MLCVSIGHKQYNDILDILTTAPLAEIRLDLCPLSDHDIKDIFSSTTPLIASFRAGNAHTHAHRAKALSIAIEAGATYIDLDIRTDMQLLQELDYSQTKVILSYHNFDETPNTSELEQIIDHIQSHAPDIVKVACYAQQSLDCIRLLHLYEKYTNSILLPMGENTELLRLSALQLGAPFIYVAPDEGVHTATGQLTYSQAQTILTTFHDYS
jgi:3-dehydroquinate dehydratase type I